MATVVDTTALWQTVLAAAAAGIGVTFAFSVCILGVARFIELNRDGRSGAALVYGVVAGIAVAACAAAVVLGVVVMTQK